MVETYAVSREEVLELVSEKMDLGYDIEEVFDAVKKDLEARKPKSE